MRQAKNNWLNITGRMFRAEVFVCLLLTAAYLPAQDAAEGESVELDLVTVTGTRIKRVDIEGATPLTVIDRQAIEAAGDATLAELLRATVYNSFGSHRDQSGWSNGLTGASWVDLRGLGPEYTLVLMDGRRVAPFAGLGGDAVNVNMIPMDMVERVEILRDGASAIYGSDAIAGVINIITRKDMNGAVATVHYEDPDAPGGEATRYSISGGSSSDRGNVTFSLEHFERDPVFERDIPHLADPTQYGELTSFGFPASGFVVGGPLRFLNFADPRCPASLGDSPLFPNAYRWDFGSGEAGSDWGFSSRCGYNYAQHIMLIPRVENSSLFLDARFDVTANTRFLARAQWVSNETETRYAGSPVTNPFPTYRADNPNNPLHLFIGQTITDPGLGTYTFTEADLADVWVLMRSVPNGTRDNFNYQDRSSVFAGFEGENLWFGGAEWDVGFAYDRDRSVDVLTNLANKVEIQNAIDRGDLDLFNVQGLDHEAWLSNTIDTLVLFNHTALYRADTDFTRLDATLSFDLFELGSGPVPVVVGMEYYDFRFSQEYDPESNRGIIAGGAGGDVITDVDRDVLTFYAESVIPMGPSLELNLAVRHDDYSDFGGTTNPKVSVAWRPVDEWLLRASWGEGFKAPNMFELYQPQRVNFGFAVDRTGCANGVETCEPWEFRLLLGGNPDLQPEESESWTAGAVWNATDALSFELTWYSIEFSNQVYYPGLQEMFDREFNGLSSTVVRKQDGTVDYVGLTAINLSGRKTEGVDFNTQYSLATDRAGLFTARLEWTRVLRWETELRLDEGFQDLIEDYGLPRDRASFSLNWSLGDLQASWLTQYVGSHGQAYTQCYPSFQLAPCTDEGDEPIIIDSYTTHDLQAAWNTPWNGQIAVGVRNLFNEDPPYHPCCRYPVDAAQGLDMYDLQGRIPYLRYKQNF